LFLQEFSFIWLAGANPELLSKCPSSEYTKQLALGATVLIPTLFSFLASGYIASSINFSTAGIITISFIWAFIILTLDRALLATYQARFWQILIRFCIGMLIAFTVSHPVALYMFNSLIDAEINKTYKEEKINKLKEEEKLLSTNKTEEIKSHEQIKKDAFDAQRNCEDNNAENQINPEIDSLKKDREYYEGKLKSIPEEITNLQQERQREAKGKGKSGNPRGKGTEYIRLGELINEAMIEQEEAEEALREINSKIRERTDEIAKQKSEKAKAKDIYCQKSKELQQTTIKDSEKKIKSLSEELTNASKELEKKINEIRNSHVDILMQTTALYKIFENEENGGFFAQIVFLCFMVLFFLIDTLPIMIKITSCGYYEKLLEHESTYSDEKNKINSKLYHVCQSNRELLSFLEIQEKTTQRLQTYMKNNHAQTVVDLDANSIAEHLNDDNKRTLEFFFSLRASEIQQGK
jgi:ABC-type multidrug transport system fused ATPase/permease subunit